MAGEKAKAWLEIVERENGHFLFSGYDARGEFVEISVDGLLRFRAAIDGQIRLLEEREKRRCGDG